jgi:hypothetical protein
MKNETPPNLAPVPNDFIYCGYGPLKVKAIGKNTKDVAGAQPNEANWTIGGLGGYGETNHYALRKGSEIARLNGLEDKKESTMKTQPHTKQMKLKLQVLNDNEIQVPTNMVAFRIVEQEAFSHMRVYSANECDFQSVMLPDFDEGGHPRPRFYVRGDHKD